MNDLARRKQRPYARISRLVASLLAVTATACSSSPSPSDEPSGTVAGVVAPADARASVDVYRDGEWIAETRANARTGVFTMDVPEGEYEVVVSSLGFLAHAMDADVRVGETTDIGTIALLRPGAGNVRGNVSPASATATVSAMLGGTSIAHAMTDSAGEFVLASVPVGVYDLVVTAPGFERNTTKTSVAVTEAETTDVGTITLVVATSPPGSLLGTVLPVGIDAHVSVERMGAQVASVEVDDSGAYRVDGLAAGTYDLVISAPTYGTDRTRVGLAVTSGNERIVPAVTLVQPVRWVEGRVVTQDAAIPLAGVVLRIGSAQTVSDSDGRFMIANPTAGEQTLRAERAFFRPVDVSIIVAATGATNAPLTLSATGEVTGTVRESGSNTQITNARVSVGDAVGWTNASGVYRLTGVTLGAGGYSATHEGHVSTSGNVEVVRGMATTLNFTLAPSVTVSGVVRVAGVAFAGALVSIAGRVVATGLDGTFSVGVPAGSQMLRVTATDHVTSTTTVVAPVADVVVTLVPAAKVTITGTVRAGSPPVPVSGAVVDAGAGVTGVSTNVMGVYTLTNVPVTRTTITVTRSNSPYQPYSGPLVLAAPGPVNMDVTLLPFARAGGRVTDLVTGAPIANATVHNTTTNAFGEYALETLTAATTQFYAAAGNCYPLQYQSIVATPGSFSSIDFALRRNPDVTVVVRDANTHAPIAGATITVVTNIYTRTSAAGDVNGSHTFTCLSPYSQVVFGAAPGYIDSSVSVSLESGESTSVVVELSPL